VVGQPRAYFYAHDRAQQSLKRRKLKVAQQQRYMDNIKDEPTQDDVAERRRVVARASDVKAAHRVARHAPLTSGHKSHVSY
jgi:hypothetical protein